ncbi:MAG: hypothetical protein WB586_20900 [Chthoniobacterales bacterium]
MRPPTILVPGSKPSTETDAAFDAMLEQTLAPIPKRQAALPVGATSTTIVEREPLPVLPRLPEEHNPGWVVRLACILCATLVLIVLGRTMESWHIASQTYMITSVSGETQSWPREPNIGVSGPTFKDPFANWAPRAVLEQLPAPGAILVHLPQASAPRAELVNPQ